MIKQQSIISQPNLFLSEKLVMDYLSHLENLKLRKEKRSEDRKISKAKQLSLKYEDFNWKKLFETNNLKSLTINVLKKYLIKHNLPITKTKKGIIDTIINHICMPKGNAFVAVKKGRTQNIGEEIDNELANEMDINSSDNSDDSDFESDNEENTVILSKFDSSDEDQYDDSSDNDKDSDMPNIKDISKNQSELLSVLGTEKTRVSGRKINVPKHFHDFYV